MPIDGYDKGHEDGYEHGCNDGYAAGLEDAIGVMKNKDIPREEKLDELLRLLTKAQ